MKNYKLLITEFFWALAPLGLGAFIWFMSWGYASSLFIYPVDFLFRYAVISGIIIIFFRKSLNDSLKNKLLFFDRQIPLPPWWVFLLLIFSGLAVILFTPLKQYATIQNLVYGVIISATIEEFIARSFFIKYKMGLWEFLLLNTISSLAFTFMHSFYNQEFVSCFDLMQRGHFPFSFMLGIIVYKAQRIELTIILHMLSNLLRYTVPVCLLNCPWPSLFAIISSDFVSILFYLALAGCAYKRIDND